MKPKITTASVKVMRSHDYCHFEVILSTDLTTVDTSQELVVIDELRKDAARLVDKAVEQYKIAKNAANRAAYFSDDRQKRLVALGDVIQVTPERERTPEEQAILKAIADSRYEARQYDYQDDWEDAQ